MSISRTYATKINNAQNYIKNNEYVNVLNINGRNTINYNENINKTFFSIIHLLKERKFYKVFLININNIK